MLVACFSSIFLFCSALLQCSSPLENMAQVDDDTASDHCNRSRLRSSKSSDVFVPRTKTKMGDRAFEVAGPRSWNSLPATIRKTKTLPAFKKQLKLYLIGNPEY